VASYVFCPVCDERHDTYEKALEDVTGLVREERYYTQHHAPPKIMRRTPMVGIGSHGGRGLFVMGVCAGLDWERLDENDLPYRYRIEVIWDGAIYGADYDEVLADVTKYNQRSWTSANREDYGLVVDRILNGEVVRRIHDTPRPPWEQLPDAGAPTASTTRRRQVRGLGERGKCPGICGTAN
jgi:hypothetical protein